METNKITHKTVVRPKKKEEEEEEEEEWMMEEKERLRNIWRTK
jgi:hypothetical protein